MTLPPLEPYLERLHLLAPAVAHDAFRPPVGNHLAYQARRHAFTAAVGLLHRHLLAVQACGETPDPTVQGALSVATATLRAAWRPSASLLAEAEQCLQDTLLRARLASTSEAPTPPTGADDREALAAQVAWEGDAEVAAERLLLLEDADEAVSLAAASSAAFGTPTASVFCGGSQLQLARLLVAGLDDATRWRVEASARSQAIQRELFTDPFGSPLWCGLLDQDRLPGLLERLAWAPAEQPPIRLAAAGVQASEEPGVLHVLLFREDHGEGVCARLAVSLRPGGAPSARGLGLGAEAWSAVRNGFQAAASLLPPGSLPPDVLENHHLDLGLNVNHHVDGNSLGLPAAIAFWSLWTGTRLPRTAATGSIDPGGRVSAVDDKALRAKLSAWTRQFDGSDVPPLVPDQPAAGATGGRCVSLAGALALLGVEPTQPVPASALGTTANRKLALQECIHAVQVQDLRRVASIDGASPWVRLADRMRLLLQSLGSAQGLGLDLDEARLWCALAYIHGACTREARELLDQVEGRSEGARFLQDLLRLNTAIDHPTQEEDDLERALAGASNPGWLQGLDLGTRGRFHLHRNRLDQALPLLEQAVQKVALPERARSRNYLAMGLRMSGRADEALGQLDLAADDLRQHTQPFSTTYHDETAMYLAYERARTLLALGRAGEALASVEAALASERLAGGWWPRLGFLRTRAQAFRTLGRLPEAERTVEEICSLAPKDPGPYQELVRDLLTEARGTSAGVVY